MVHDDIRCWSCMMLDDALDVWDDTDARFLHMRG